MTLRDCLVVGISVLLAASGMASEPVTLESGETSVTFIELFTSEGCSSCPAAEKWLSQWKTKPELWTQVVPVAFHVDYWDRLGWRDRFARPEFTERQRRYANAWRSESVYTPGFAVNGREWKGWFNGGTLPLPAAKSGNLRVTFDEDGRLTGTFSSPLSKTPSLELEAALLGSNLSSDIKRGENSGRKLVHDFVVLQVAKTPMTVEDNQAKASLTFSPNHNGDKPTGLAAWVHPTNDIAPIQATGGWIGKKP